MTVEQTNMVAEKGKDEPLAELGVAPSTDGKSGTHGTTTPSH